MSDIKWDERKAFEDALQGPWDPEDKRFDAIKKAMKTLFDQASEDFQYWVESDLASNISFRAASTAEKIVEAILAGNEDELKRYIGATGYTGRDRNMNPVFHGKIFEPSGIQLRRQICEAHADLLKNERILDLESQLADCVKQIAKLEADLERCRYER